jgi:hypothetical protein
MNGIRFDISLLILTLMIICGQSGAIMAQNASQTGLPPVIENYGLSNPPDLPESGSNEPATPINSFPSRSTSSSGNGGTGILNTLDNLPPVGNTAQAMPSEPRSSGIESKTDSTDDRQSFNQNRTPPHAVRFGDVRSESEALKQFPELRRESRTRQDTFSPVTNRPESSIRNNPSRGPLKFLDRFLIWKRNTPEPPLDKPGAISPDDFAVESPKDSGSLSNRAELADKTDSDIQKRIERLARQEIGNRTSTMDVEVIDREIYIKAKPMWFWQRRQLSEDLQNLPGVEKKRLHITVY